MGLLPRKDKSARPKPFEDLGDHFICDRKATLASSNAALRGRESFTHIACRMDDDPTALSHVVLGIETFEPTGQTVFAYVDLTRNEGAPRRGVGVGLVRQPLHPSAAIGIGPAAVGDQMRGHVSGSNIDQVKARHPRRLCKIDYPNHIAVGYAVSVRIESGHRSRQQPRLMRIGHGLGICCNSRRKPDCRRAPEGGNGQPRRSDSRARKEASPTASSCYIYCAHIRAVTN